MQEGSARGEPRNRGERVAPGRWNGVGCGARSRSVRAPGGNPVHEFRSGSAGHRVGIVAHGCRAAIPSPLDGGRIGTLSMSHTLNIAALGFLLCLLAMLALLLQLWYRPRRSMAAWAMAAAVCASIAWSACGFVFAIDPTPGRWAALRWGELLRAAAWPAFVLVLLQERSAERTEASARGRFAAW